LLYPPFRPKKKKIVPRNASRNRVDLLVAE
jgi:hypothetical protein